MKILIAGAGIAGSVLTRMLRERGHDVILTDARPDRAASRCAFAYLRTAWWKGEERAEVRRAVDWYEKRGWVLARHASVSDLRRDWTRDQADHILIDPRGPLVKPDLAMNLHRWSGTPGVTATLGDGLEVQADRLVLACGAGTSRWTHGVQVHGGVWEVPEPAVEPGLRLLRVTDRLTYTAARDRNTLRVGASKALTPEAARQRAVKILGRMFTAGLVSPELPWTYRAGTRWEHRDRSPGGARRVSERVWEFTGFARSGYARVPGAAQYLIRRLEEKR